MQGYERYLELLELCFRAKEKGHDCFFNYYPHAQQMSIQIYKDGWNDFTETYDKKFEFYISDFWKDSEEKGPAVCLEAIAYINDLLEEEEK